MANVPGPLCVMEAGLREAGSDYEGGEGRPGKPHMPYLRVWLKF